MSPTYAAFSPAEHRSRLARAREKLGAAGFEVCISVAPETHYYLAGYDAWVGVNSPQALVFSVAGDDEPTLISEFVLLFFRFGFVDLKVGQ